MAWKYIKHIFIDWKKWQIHDRKTPINLYFMVVYGFVSLITVSRKQKAIANLNSIINRPEVMDIKGTIRESHPFKTCEKTMQKKIVMF